MSTADGLHDLQVAAPGSSRLVSIYGFKGYLQLPVISVVLSVIESRILVLMIMVLLMMLLMILLM